VHFLLLFLDFLSFFSSCVLDIRCHRKTEKPSNFHQQFRNSTKKIKKPQKSAKKSKKLQKPEPSRGGSRVAALNSRWFDQKNPKTLENRKKSLF
jgi:hypothetical protein